MPTVKRYGQQQVSTAAMPGVRGQAAETAESLGAGVQRARERTGEAIGGMGATIARVGLDRYTRIKETARRRADELGAFEGSNKVGSFLAELQHGENGYLTVKGKDAQALPEQVLKQFDEYTGQVEKTLGTDTQKLIFAREVAQRRAALQVNVLRHATEQAHEWRKEELAKGIENDYNEALAAALDPAQADIIVSRMAKNVETQMKAMGKGPEVIEAEVDRVRVATLEGIISRLVTNGQDVTAKAYFEQSKDQIKGPALERIEKTIEAGSTAGNARRASDEIWKQLGPTDESAPINLDLMEQAARDKFPDDEKALAATIQKLRERKVGVDAGRKARQEATEGTLWGAVAQGASLAAIESMPEYLKADGPTRLRVSNFIVDEAEKRANRAYTAEVRDEARLNRAEAARRRADAEQERANWSKMWRYADPVALSKMSDDQILMLVPEVGIEHVNRLMSTKRSITKSEETVRAATIDDDLFKRTAHSAGLPAYDSTTTEAKKAELGQLRYTVESAIAAQQARTGKAMSYGEKETLMRSIVDQKVIIDVWGSDSKEPNRVAAAIVNPTDRENAYVPIANIEPKYVNELVSVLRSELKIGPNVTDAQIIAGHKFRIEKAHAAERMGLSYAEQIKRLTGR